MSRLLSALLFVCGVTLATALAPVFDAIQSRHETSNNALLALVGDSRRLFANQFFTMADVYFHSGYYPSMFDAKKTGGPTHLDVESHVEEAKEEGPDDDENFLGRPKDWIDAFGRRFFPTVHTHLQGSNAREILPWLKISAELDPHRIDTYVTASYWLRTFLNRPTEAEDFLRQGLRANPDSYEILLELGRVYLYSYKNIRVARNIFELALVRWNFQDQSGKNPDPRVKEQILGEMVRTDEKTGDLKQLLADLLELDKVSHSKETIDKYIQDVQKKLGAK